MAVLFERKFVFLLPKDLGYEGAMGQTPKGHIEIEKKGEELSFKVFLENLKEMTYQIQLFTFGGRCVILDEVSVGQSGKKEEEYHTRNSDVFHSGIHWQEFEVIVIRALGQQHSSKAALVAWINSTKGVKKKVPYIDEKSKQELKEKQPKESTLDQNLEETEEIEEEKSNIKQEEHTKSEWEEYWVDLDEDTKEEYSKQKTEYDKDLEIKPEVEPKIPEEPEVPYHYMNQNIEKWEKLVPEIKPFTPAMENHKWWKILKDQKDLEGFYLYYNGSFVNITYPYMGYRNIGEAYIEEYNYMLFGIVFDEDIEKRPSYYVYGIPGRLCAQDQPFQGKTGFLYWHPAKDNRVEEGEMGYWLLYVEAHSGTIAIPKRPTIAPICDL